MGLIYEEGRDVYKISMELIPPPIARSLKSATKKHSNQK